MNFHAEQVIRAVLTDRPIAYHPILARAVKSVTGGVFLSQLLYWTPRSRDPDGWIRKTQEDMTAETALSRREQETAREACKKAGVLEWKLRGLPAQLNYRVDLTKLAQILAQLPPTEFPDDGETAERPSGPMGPAGHGLSHPDANDVSTPRKLDRRKAPTKFGGKRQTGLDDRDDQEGRDPPDLFVGSRQAFTETTTEITTEIDVVVGALRDRGISVPVAEQLARYPADYVLAKCEQVDWLIETKSRAVGKNAAGYLRRAIEEDYTPPPHYRSRADREAEAAARAQEAAAEAERLRELAAEEARARELDFEALVRQYPPQPIPGTLLTTAAVWEETLARLEAILSRPNFEVFVRGTLLLRCDGAEATIGARSAFDAEQLTDRLDRHITPTLQAVIGHPIRCTYVSLTTVVDEDSRPDVVTPESVASHRATPRRGVPTGGRA